MFKILIKQSNNLCGNKQVCRLLATLKIRNGNSEDERQRAIMSKGLPKQKPIDGVKQILIVASGKGGVGKSTTSVNLATALKIAAPDKSIGLLDADVFGPSIPLMMNLHQSPMLNKQEMMEPLVNYGVKCMSMGFLVDQRSPVIWRGLMVMSALDKLTRRVAWGPLDYLIIDTPPGTGDTMLSLLQNLPVDGALIVTTPQKAAVEVARRGARMFEKLDIPIAGLVENMTSIACPKCQHDVPLFGAGSETLARDLGIEILQKFPLDEETRESSDSGKPIVVSSQDSPQSKLYMDLANRVHNFLQKVVKQK